jgi:hypothetical protein
MSFIEEHPTYVRYSTALFACIFLVAAFVFERRYRLQRSQLVTSIQDAAQQKTITAAQELNAFISRLVPVTNEIAQTLASKKLSADEIEALLKERKPTDFFGLGVAFAPYAFDSSQRLFAPYYFENKGKDELVLLNDSYDYTDPNIQWFHNPLTQGAQFSSPYIGIASKTILAEYGVPFYNAESTTNEPAGIVFANQSIEHLNAILSSHYHNQTGYWFIVSKEGIILAHPEKKFSAQLTSLPQIAREQNNKPLELALEKAATGTPVMTTYDNEINGATSWLFGQPLTTTGWTLFYSFDISEIALSQTINDQQIPDFDRQHLMHITLLLLLAILCGLTCCFSMLPFRPEVLWYWSASISSALLIAIAVLWALAQWYPDYVQTLEFIKSKKDLITLFSPQPSPQPTTSDVSSDTPAPSYQMLTLTNQSITLIPTGIFINHLNLTADHKLEIVAYLWQHYNTADTQTERGFILPQASAVSATKIVHQKDGPIEKIVWLVEATLNQELVFKRYPFDVKDLQIDIWPQDLEKQIVLIPDFDSYELINPRSLPGINSTARINGWRFEGSYFGYKKTHYGTLFGLYSYGPFGILSTKDSSRDYELSFNVMIKRNLIDTIIADLIPLAVIALLLFVILVTATQQGYAVLGSCAGVFFGTIIEHARFRGKTGSESLVFFENLYLIMYGTILAITIVSLLYLLHFTIYFIQYRTNIISQLLFWPIMFAAILLLSGCYLY